MDVRVRPSLTAPVHPPDPAWLRAVLEAGCVSQLCLQPGAASRWRQSAAERGALPVKEAPPPPGPPASGPPQLAPGTPTACRTWPPTLRRGARVCDSAAGAGTHPVTPQTPPSPATLRLGQQLTRPSHTGLRRARVPHPRRGHLRVCSPRQPAHHRGLRRRAVARAQERPFIAAGGMDS